jgi:hypothetical protein
MPEVRRAVMPNPMPERDTPAYLAAMDASREAMIVHAEPWRQAQIEEIRGLLDKAFLERLDSPNTEPAALAAVSSITQRPDARPSPVFQMRFGFGDTSARRRVLIRIRRQRRHACLSRRNRACRRVLRPRSDFLYVCGWKTNNRSLARGKEHCRAVVAATRLAHRRTTTASPWRRSPRCRVGFPVASMLLHLASSHYPALDFRALWSLGDTSARTTYTMTFWISHAEYCRQLAQDAGVDMPN